MCPALFRYQFAESVPMPEIEETFVLAILATEAIHGESETRLMAEHAMDVAKRACIVDANTTVGMDLNKLFVGFLNRQFGGDAFRVRMIPNANSTTQKSD